MKVKIDSWTIFIGPESDHWLCLSVTPSLTHCCLVNLMALYDPNYLMMSQQLLNVFIGPECDHCLPLSVTDSLTD